MTQKKIALFALALALAHKAAAGQSIGVIPVPNPEENIRLSAGFRQHTDIYFAKGFVAAYRGERSGFPYVDAHFCIPANGEDEARWDCSKFFLSIPLSHAEPTALRIVGRIKPEARATHVRVERSGFRTNVTLTFLTNEGLELWRRELARAGLTLKRVGLVSEETTGAKQDAEIEVRGAPSSPAAPVRDGKPGPSKGRSLP